MRSITRCQAQASTQCAQRLAGHSASGGLQRRHGGGSLLGVLEQALPQLRHFRSRRSRIPMATAEARAAFKRVFDRLASIDLCECRDPHLFCLHPKAVDQQRCAINTAACKLT